MILRSLAVLALICAPAFAEPARPPKADAPKADALKIEGTFAFDIMKSERTKCAKVAGALLTKLNKSYRCARADPSQETASGIKALANCKAKKGRSEYMLFTTMHDCEEERGTQEANGD
jgi:hypothetical protein